MSAPVRLLRQSKCYLKNNPDIKANYCDGTPCSKFAECLKKRVEALSFLKQCVSKQSMAMQDINAFERELVAREADFE